MDLFKKLENHHAIPPFLEKRGHFVVDDFLGISILTTLAFKEKGGHYLIIASNLYKAQKVYDLLSSFLPDANVLLFPHDELVRAEGIAQSKEMVAGRLYCLDNILKNRADIVITNVAGAARYLPNPDLFKEKTIYFKVGESYDFSEIRRQLTKNGYLCVNKVDQSLQYAIRGDILDIYSVNNDNPVRIEFFGDEVESIRYFDLAKQTSIEQINEITILPGSDVLLSEDELANAPDKIFDQLQKDQSHFSLGDFEALRNITETDVIHIKEGLIDHRTYKYYSYITNKHYSISDYCKGYTRILLDINALESSNELLQNESLNYLIEMHSLGRIISHLEMYQDIFRIYSKRAQDTITTSCFAEKSSDILFDAKMVPFQASKLNDAFNIIQTYLNDAYDILISLNSKEHLNSLIEGLESLKMPYEMVHDYELSKKSHIAITLTNLEHGFYLPNEKLVVITGSELFNEKVKATRYDNRFKEATILKSFEDLKPGDFVVHEYQGIGQFLELQTLEVDGVHKDYLKIAYSGGEYLYVPLAQFQLVRKFMGKEGLSPRLSRLHSKDWENTKKRIKERVDDLAERLMHLYIERSKVQGFAFPKDDEFQHMFESSFPYPLTHDQDRAIKEIKEDMEKPSPMDRLLCGDVGFGKTEVAFQAAFKAINSGKQVAILCPTTLLARQHYELACQRFEGFDINIAIFSRLIPEKTQKEYIKRIKEGDIHLIIGTHRLLSKDIVFKDLGLLIVDEEQRFGVEQKERLKELKSNIDVLSLSATPIPRTLQISLLGVRSLSKIDTPPSDRMPIQTYVTPYRQDVVKELIERELGRKGQVFYLHNNISSLYLTANRIASLVPSAHIAVAHGQMSRDEIEDTMMKFYKGDVDVLICTSIVENGIDVPNANMIIVEDSDHYGLAQLYQIKGRVGRSNRIAYAYLMYNEYKELNEKALKRLKALQEFTELGSGYKIAQRDLMIRGAGDILGPEQAGFIDSIGLDMYIKLLNESVQEKLHGKKEEKAVETNPNLSVEAYIPEGYLTDSDKIELYQEIMSSPSCEDLAYLKVKTRDIFGHLPTEVDSLFKKRNVDLLMKEANLNDLKEHAKTIEIFLGDKYINIRGIGNILFESLIPYLSFIKISYANNLFKILVTKTNDWLNDLEHILTSLANIQKKYEAKEIAS